MKAIVPVVVNRDGLVLLGDMVIGSVRRSGSKWQARYGLSFYDLTHSDIPNDFPTRRAAVSALLGRHMARVYEEGR